MAKPEILWAFLPNGIKGGKLKFSAAVSIRLPEAAGPNPNLGLFPEVLSWAATVKDLTFDLQFEKGTPIQAVRTSPDPDPELWQAIFQPDSPVLPYKFADLTKSPVFAFPVRHVRSFLAQQYINVAAESPEAPPAMETVFRNEGLAQVRLKPVTQPRFAQAVRLRTTEQVLAQGVRAKAEGQKVRAFPAAAKPSPPQDFYLLRLCHRPKNKAVIDPKTKRPVVPRVPIKPPELDFHQAVSHLANYPALMRLLGLALDFEVDLPAGRLPATGLVRVSPRGRDDRWAWTKYALDQAKGTFAPVSRESRPDVVDGFLDLSDDERYDLVEVDVDGAALKAADLADQAEDSATADLPALRSSGISVVRTGNAVFVAEAFRAALELNQSFEKRRELTFYAEDLVQGYRVDVWDEAGGAWRSLCRRVGTYRFLRSGRDVTLEDEGFVSESVTQAADDSSDDIFTHESIFTWNGWSLVAPRPGRTIDEEDKAADIQSRAATAFRLEARFKPPAGSLPRLRFGQRYRLRARAVDLAGNGVGPDSPDSSRAIPAPPREPYAYSRFDPVPPPVVVPRQAAKRGESVDAVIIRSFNDGIDKDAVPTGESAERHIVPPKTSQLGAETHGMFDAAGGGLRKDIYEILCRKDPGQLQEVEPGQEIELPYFPDPWALGAVVRGLPGVPADKPLRLDFSGEWPAKRPFRLRIEEGDRPAAWDESSRVLTVPLKKSDVVTLQLSCWFPPQILPHLGLYRWLEKPELVLPPKILQAPQATAPLLVAPPGLRPAGAGDESRPAAAARPQAARLQARPVQAAKVAPQAAAAQIKPVELGPVFQLPRIDLARLRKIALDGSHWMMTPFRTVTLVHAVQQPLGRPGAKTFGVRRGLGDTHAVFEANLDVHGSSSQKFDLAAVWKEPVDNVREKAWRTLDGAAHVLEQPLGRGLTSFAMTAATDHRHEFRDTKYRRVTYELTETTRFREQMPEEIAASPELLIRKSEPITIDVPNAAPPALPGIVYIVPTFGWERNREPGKFTSRRKGGGLRVYLERPWFSSGDGELLGVVLPPTPGVPSGLSVRERTAEVRTSGGRTAQARPKPASRAVLAATAAPAVTEALRPYVTLWGQDPLWRAGSIATPEYPLPADFGLAGEVLGGLALPDLPGVPSFTAVGHEVEFDEERGLWFCDIDIDPHDAYFPFVRLALARFQPISVPGAHLSKVVTADFIQLAPDRTVSVAFNRSNPKELNVTVGGPSYVQAAAGSGPGEIEVSLETRNLALPDEIGWTAVPEATAILKAQRAAAAEPGNFLWAGKIKVPAGLKLKVCRVAVREYETFVSDAIERPARTKTVAAAPPLKRVRRLVFAETFPFLDI
ncbi:MAG TPA: hypothetical protein P5119_05790 [Candidatus Aminicenantes bacterium]|nr:hypothetical protein [Candidatus Aminicenantes bacterium]HRY64835.1 hypothetical protein [Candidatus Aminicenantes bacterium]HRZ71748.1 hypothetical protein [Candidatus Aminicenantes bacterium]